MPTDGQKMRDRIKQIVRYIITGSSIAFLGVLLACYIPKIRFYYNDLPNLKITSVNEDSEEIILLPNEFQEKQIICFWTNHQDVKVYLEDQEVYNTIEEEQVLFGISAKRKTRISELPMYFGQVMILVGLLLRVGFKGIPIHWMNEYTKDLIGYLTFFTATIPMYIYISKKEYASRLFETICGVLAVIQLITSMILFLLHAVNVCDVSKFLWLGAMFWGMFILLSLFRSIRLFWKKKKSTTVMTLFTCTYGGNERYTLRCVRSNQ